jgi:hypothetical protein
MKKVLSFVAVLCIAFTSKAQLTGTKNIPGDYANLTAAITDLNLVGVGLGGVVLNVVASNPQTGSGAAYQITTLTSSSSNPISIVGNANTITYTGTAGVLDGIFVLNSTDYVTIDNFVMAGDVTTEWGVALLTSTANNGAKNNTIQNCTITLDKTNAASVGVYTAHHTAASATALTVTLPLGTNSNNKFYNNTVQNCYSGYSLTGFPAVAPYDLYDQQNEIGTTGMGRSQVLNFGGGATQAQAVITISQNKLKVFKTNINSTGGVNGTGILYGIFTNTAVNASVDLYSDTITLVSAGTINLMTGINNTAGITGAGNTINIYNNVIQNCTYATATTALFRGIVQSATASYTNIYNNKVVNNTLPGTGELSGIYCSGLSATLVLNVNINDNEVSNNSKTGISGTLYMIYASTATNTTNFFNNLIYNNNQSVASTGASYGYYNFAFGYNENVYNNQVYNCTGGTGETVAIFARNGSGPTNKTVNSNTIYGIIGGGQVGAIWFDYATKGSIYKNNVYNITSNASATLASVYGIQVGSNVGTRVDIYNNFISELKAPVSTNADAIYGLWLQSGVGIGQISAYHNTVYLNATSTSLTTFGTAAILLSANSVSIDLQNNILVNTSTPGPTGGNTTVILRAVTALTNYNLLSGNNCLYAGVPAANKLIFRDGTNNDQTLQAFKDRVNPRDQSSFTELPPFINVASSPYNLHLAGTIQCESGGQPIVSITTDYDGNARNITTPDVGADEFSGTMLDIAAPNIQYSLLGNDIVAANRAVNLFAKITDPSAINVTAGTNPRLYYKKKTQANTYNDNTSATDGWKYVEASNATSPFTFTIDYTKLLTGAVVAADTIQYFVIAQDLAATPLVGLNAGAFTSPPSSVNLMGVNFPLLNTINQYGISGNTFAGTINVGSTETITSLTNVGGLFQQLKAGVVTADVTVNITSDLMLENGQFALANWNESGSGKYSMTFVPNAATIRTIQGLSSSAALIRLDSADRVTFDGRFAGAGNYLRIRNTNSLNPGILLVNDAQNNTIRNCIIESNNTSTAINIAGGINIGNSNIINGTGNDNNVITLNELRDRSDISGTPLILISAAGSTGSLDLFNSNNTISNNNIHDFFSATTTNQAGIFISTGNTNFNIDSNSIYQTVPRVYTTTNVVTRGIFLNQASPLDNIGGHNIRKNYIGGTSPLGGTNGNYWTLSSTGTIANAFQGITVSTGLLPTLVQGNVVKNIDYTSASPAAATSMFFALSLNNGKINVNNNQVGAPTGNDSLKLTFNTNGGTNNTCFTAGIITFNGTSSTTDITANKIGGITIGGSTTALVFNQIIQTQGTPSANFSVADNMIGSMTTANSIQTNLSANPQSFIIGIRTTHSTGITPTFNNNNIQNITDNSTNVGTSDYGIFATNTVGLNTSPIVTNNVIKNISCAGTPATPQLIAYGISVQNYGGANQNISNNIISGIRTTTTGTTSPFPIGIYVTNGSSGGVINKNKVFDLTNTATGTAAGIYGIYTGQGANWTVSNNMVSINNAANMNNLSINGIVDGILNGNVNVFYNSVYIGGSAAAGAQNSYGYLRFNNANTALRNNLIYMDRTGGTGFSYAVSNLNGTSDGWSPTASSYNTFITPTSTNVAEWNALAQTFAGWKLLSNGDKESYADINANVTAANLFTNTAIGDLTIKTANAESWYANGKGIAGAMSGNIATDFAGDVRGTTIGMPTDIGADEFVPDAGVLPPNAVATGLIAPSSTTSFSFAGRKLGEITWGALGTLPSNITWKYYSSITPSTTLSINSYHDVNNTLSDGSGYTYDMKLYYTESEKNQLTDANLRGAKKDGASPWIDLAGPAGSSDISGKYVTSPALTNFSLFTLRDFTTLLPIQLISFEAKLNNLYTVDVQWSVAQQVNIKQYEVERSVDGRNFYSIAIVNANNNTDYTYTYNDAKPVIGVNYYRIKIIENNGKFTNTNMQSVLLQGKESFVMYPLPAIDKVTIQTNKKNLLNTTATLVDLQGKIINSFKIISSVQVMNVQALPKGIYFLRTADGNSYKLVK